MKEDGRKRSPRWAAWILTRLSRFSDRYSLADDLDIEFVDLRKHRGCLPASLWYGAHAVHAVAVFTLHNLYWRCVMFKNYLKIALRNIRKYRGYTFINIFGLAVGMACCILILAFIVDELSYDRFHANADDIYRVTATANVAGRVIDVVTIQAPMAEALVEEFPEVLNAVRFRNRGRTMFSYEDNKFFEPGFLYTDNSIFDVFSFHLLRGDPGTALAESHTLVLTEEVARKYFGSEDPVGKIIRMNNAEDFRITGIVEKPPANSHIQFDILASFETYMEMSPNNCTWGSWNFQTYLRLQEGTNPAEIEEKFVPFNETHIGDMLRSIGGELTNRLQPLKSIHLYSHMENELSANGDIRYVYAFSAIALFILLIACINFMNLSTARSANRAREVGLRKVVGARRTMLTGQFLGESLLTAVLSLAVALVIVRLALPFFNHLANRSLDTGFLLGGWILLGLVSIVCFVGFVAGSYPALFLSGFQPVGVLRGEMQKGAKHSRFRSILVVLQFAVSITLIIGTGIVMRQLNHMKTMRLGFNKEQKLIIEVRDHETRQKLQLIKTEMLALPGVLNACGSMAAPGQDDINTGVYFPEGFETEGVLLQNFYIDEDFIETYGIELMAGRSYSREMATDRESAIVINETAVRKFGWEDPIGKRISDVSDQGNQLVVDGSWLVIGVIRDIHHRPVRHLVEPAMLTYRPDYAATITLNLGPDNIPETLRRIEAAWKRIAPHHPFDYFFLDQHFDGLYRSEEQLSSIFKAFTLFAILIGCLGLFGLASFAAEQRTKEIGIRKVLGSSEGSIILLLCREFVFLILIANILAWPAAFFTMKNWLRGFPYQADMRITTFLLAGIMAILIALFTVSYRAVRAAAANPVDALKYE